MTMPMMSSARWKTVNSLNRQSFLKQLKRRAAINAGHDWWQVHAETGDLVVEYNSPGGNSQEKEDVQEVATIESTKKIILLTKRQRETQREL